MELSKFFEDDKIECQNCGWCWDSEETEPHDKYVCHKCWTDNTEFYEDFE
jgi:DNA-directed RNA polymerase subunit RPC12/RpoP